MKRPPFGPPRLRRERQETRQRTRHPPRRGSLVHSGSLEFYRKRGEKETILLLRYRTAILTALCAGVVLLAVGGWLLWPRRSNAEAMFERLPGDPPVAVYIDLGALRKNPMVRR